jgi:hypothetical protein
LAIVIGALSWGCGSEDTGDRQCGNAVSPEALVVLDVEPAMGSSVANAEIVHRFTVSGLNGLLQPALGLPPSHTAGMPAPATLTWSAAHVGTETTYTATAVAWSTAPAHVELQPTRNYELDGCIYALPTPLFSYDVTAP